MRPRNQSGVTLPELMLVAWLFALVLLGLARFAAAQGRLAASTQDRVRTAELVRTTGLILSAEMRYLARPDFQPGRTAVRLRAVRGVGVICDGTGSAVRVRYRGVRRPDSEKDSALVVNAGGTAGSPYRIVAVSADTACGTGYRLGLEPEPPSRGIVLVFEPGSYHLADGAFRYRRGGAGRQPVTEALLESGRFEAGSGLVHVRLRLHPDSVVRVPARTSTTTVRVMNPHR